MGLNTAASNTVTLINTKMTGNGFLTIHISTSQSQKFCKNKGVLMGNSRAQATMLHAKRWDRRNRADLVESATPCHDAEVVRSCRG